MIKKLQKSNNSIDTIVSAGFFEGSPSAIQQRRTMAILQAAIACYNSIGIENTTYEHIAKRAKVSRPLIFKYFVDHDEIFYKAIKLIRIQFQQFAVDAMRVAPTPAGKLKAYIESVFDWQKHHADFAMTLFLFLARCSRNERDRDMNTQFTVTGRSRIAALIRLGVEAKEFACEDPEAAAHKIQTFITGALASTMSESAPESSTYKSLTLDVCLGLVGIKNVSK